MATKYLVSGGNGIWSNSSNWSLTSGGTSGTGQPSANDDVIFDANSLNAPITISSTANCLTVFMSNYTGTITYSAPLNVAQSFEYSAGTITAGSNALHLGNNTSTPASACAVNFNGVTHNANLNFNNTNGTGCTYTITGDLNVMGSVGFSNSNTGGSSVKATVNGGNILCNSGFSIYGNGSRWVTGTSKIYFVGTGSGNFTSGVSAFFLNMDIVFAKKGGTINMTTGAIYTRGTSITYVSGNFTNFLLVVNTSSAILNTNNMVWSAVSIGGGTLTNSSTLNISGSFNIGTAQVIGGIGDIYCGSLVNTVSFGLTVGKSVYITNSWSSVATESSQFIIYSGTLGVQVEIILGANATQDVSHTNARDINSNGGKTIYSYRVASLTNTNNWATLPIITSINTKSIIQ